MRSGRWQPGQKIRTRPRSEEERGYSGKLVVVTGVEADGTLITDTFVFLNGKLERPEDETSVQGSSSAGSSGLVGYVGASGVSYRFYEAKNSFYIPF